jgi:hypothetical protein
VLLSDLYTHGLTDDSQSDESRRSLPRPEYFKHVGALDESDPKNPRVIIPNYMLMPENCLNVSSHYDLCCVDLCEDFLDQLEDEFKAPQASPAEIMKFLSTISSAYVDVGRTYSDALVKKLHEVADKHGGMVPFHGRLFSQWMHFAYPLECSYPHVAGTTVPMSYSEWFEKTGTLAVVDASERHSLVDGAPGGQPLGTSSASLCDGSDSEEGLCMWVAEEQLVDDLNFNRERALALSPSSSSAEAGAGAAIRILKAFVFVAGAGSVFLSMRNLVHRTFMKSMKLDLSAVGGANGDKALA